MLKNFLFFICCILLFSNCFDDSTRWFNSEGEFQESEDGIIYVSSSGKRILFPREYELTYDEMHDIALDLENNKDTEDEINLDDADHQKQETSPDGDVIPLKGISPGQTKNFSVWTGHYDNLYSSKNGLRTFTIWVRDNRTVVNAYWYEEVTGGYNWVFRGSNRVSGAYNKFSRTVNLKPTENFKLRIKGVASSPGKRKICYYSVQCSEDYWNVQSYGSSDFSNTDTWFKADDYQKWYWGGCTCWLVVNNVHKHILLIDAYVSKSTIGGSYNYNYRSSEAGRVARFVNIVRGFIAEGYNVVGVLTSHKHGDHIGDLPYVLGGIKSSGNSNFMNSGIALKGSSYDYRIPVLMNIETYFDPYYGDDDYADSYRPEYSEIIFPDMYSDGSIDGHDFEAGSTFYMESFKIVPYIWYHGKIADGISNNIRTLAYNIENRYGRDTAKVFITTGYVERKSQLQKINRTISCHHWINAWNGSQITADAAKMINLLSNSPVSYNYIFTNHGDNNSNAVYYSSYAKRDVTDMFGQFVENGVVKIYNRYTYWKNALRRVRLGYFRNRLGD